MREPKERSGYDKTKSVVVEETETTRLFRNADGTLTAQLSSGPARLADEDGTWQDIDLTLRRVGDRFEPIASPTPVSFATESGDGPIAEVRLGTDSLRLAPSELVSDIEGTKRSEGALPVIAYSGALPGGISLAIAPTTVGVETIYTVPDSSAALAPLVERYEMREGWTARQNGTAIELLDASGSVRAIWAGGFATDSADQPAETDVTVQLLPDANGAASATVVVAPEWLNDPRRVYPIKIDPSITTVRNAGEPGMGDSWIRDRQPNTNGWSSGELRLGNDGSDFLGDPPSSVYRTLLKFRTDLPADAVVESATVKLYETMAWSCEPTPFNSVRAFSPWGPGTTWESQPAADAPENGGAALAAKGLAGCPAGWVDITGPEVEAYVQGWNNALHGKPGGFANNGLLLLADNETDADAQYGWKKFASSEAGKPPELWITYSRPPTGPAPRIPAHGAVINSPRPVLTVFPATSPTNGAVDYWFEVATGADMSGNTVASSGWQSPTSYTVPDGALQDGVTYYWRATARADGLETDGPVRSFRHDRRFGTGGPSPQDPVGPVSVNLATGNLALGVSSPKFPTVGGEVGLDFSYNSLAPDKAGLRGTYFDVANQPTPNLDNADDLLQRVDSTVAFDWASGSPQSGVVPSDNFGVRWTGYLTTPSNVPSGQYFFGAYHDDGIVITVDGTKVVDLWAPNGGTLHYGSPVTLGSGETVPVQIDFYEAGAGAAVNFYVKGAVNEQPVPASWLSTEPPTLPRGWSMSADLDGSVSYGSARYANDRIVLVGPGGETTEFTAKDGGWAPPPGVDDIVTQNATTKQTTVHGEDGNIYTFDSRGELESVVSGFDDRKPAAPKFTLSGPAHRLTKITDRVTGRDVVTLSYGTGGCPSPPGGTGLDPQPPAGMLCQLSYWDGTVTKIFYRSGQLARIVDPGDEVTDFGYGTLGMLDRLRDPAAADWVAVNSGARDTDYAKTIVEYNNTATSRVTAVKSPAPSGLADTDAQRLVHNYKYTAGSDAQVDIAGVSPAATALANAVFGGFGATSDVPIAGDWDGNGTDTIGVYRPSTSEFFLRNSLSGGTDDIYVHYGVPGDMAIVGDWNGDGRDSVGVFRPSTNEFFLNNSPNPNGYFVFGSSGDQPVMGDWNGDGIDTGGVFRPSTAQFFVRNTNSTGPDDASGIYGENGDRPLAGDWDANGTDTVGVYRPSTSEFFLRNSIAGGSADVYLIHGAAGDQATTGDWDGPSGRAALPAVFHDATWSARDATTAARRVSFDLGGRTIRDSDAMGRTSLTAWNDKDEVIASVDPAGLKSTTIHDPSTGWATESFGPAPDACFSGLRPDENPATCPDGVPRTTTAYDEAIKGLAAAYWPNRELDGPPKVHATASNASGELALSWGAAGPAGLTDDNGNTVTDNWSARFTGTITLTTPGSYTFAAYSDDGVRVWVNDKLVVDGWGSPSASLKTGTTPIVTEAPDTRYRVRVEFQEWSGGAEVSLQRAFNGGNWFIVPGEHLSPRYGLVTTATDADGKVTRTEYERPELGLATASVQDPAGLNLRTTTAYEPAGSGYLRRISRALPRSGSAAVSAYTQAVAADGAVAHWRLGDSAGTTAADARGANNGTYNGSVSLGQPAGLSEGDTAAKLTGGHVTTPYQQSGVTAYTAEAWVKTTDTGLRRAVIQDRGAVGGAGKSLTLSIGGTYPSGPGAAGNVAFALDADDTYIGAYTAQTVNDGQWHHIVGTWSAPSGTAVATNQFAIYIDGQPAATTAVSVGSAVSPLSGLGGTKLGRSDAFDTRLAGSVDEAAVYTAVLPPARVAAHYAFAGYSAQVRADAPAAYWRLGEASGSTAGDVSGSANHGSYSGAHDKAQPGAVLDGDTAVTLTGGHVTTPYVQSNLTAYTAEAWVKTTDAGMNKPVIQDRGPDGSGGRSLTLSIGGSYLQGPGAPGNVAFALDADNTYVGAYTSKTVNDGNWHHIVGTWSAPSGTAVAPGQFIIYIDGQLASTTPVSVGSGATSPLTGSGGTKLGRSDAYNTTLSGTIDEASVYPTALSAARIAAHYAGVPTSVGPSQRTYSYHDTPGVPVGTTQSETKDNPCTPGTESIDQAGALERTTEPDPDGIGPRSSIVREVIHDEAGRTVATRVVGDERWTCTSYDARGRVASQTDSKNKTTTMNYSTPLQTVVTFVDSGGTTRTTTQVVDLLGRVLTYTDEHGTRTRSTYDNAGRLTATFRQLAGQAETQLTGAAYNPAGQPTVTRDYSGGAERATNHGYDAAGRPTTTSLPNGVVSTTGYGERGDVASLAHTKGASTLSAWSYARNLSGDVKTETGNGRTRAFTYDGASRLTTVTQGATTRQYAYDANSNRCGLAAICDGSWLYDAADRLLASPYATSYTYDHRGNMTSAELDGGPPTNTLNQQFAMSPSGTSFPIEVGTEGQVVADLDWSGQAHQNSVVGGSIPASGNASSPITLGSLGYISSDLSWTQGTHNVPGAFSSTAPAGGNGPDHSFNATGTGTITAGIDWSSSTQSLSRNDTVALTGVKDFPFTVTANGNINATLSWSGGIPDPNLDLCLVSPANVELYCSAAITGTSESISGTNGAVSGSYPTGAVYKLRVKGTLAGSGGTSFSLNWTSPVTANVDLELYGPTGTKVAQATSTTAKPESLSYAMPANSTGTYKLRAVSKDHAAPYSITASYPVLAHADLTFRLKDPTGAVKASARSADGASELLYLAPSGGAYTLEVINHSTDLAVPSFDAETRVPRSAGSMTLVLKNAAGNVVDTATGTKPLHLEGNQSPGSYTLLATATSGSGTATLSASWPGREPAQTIAYDGNDHATEIDDGTTRVTETLSPSGRVLRRVVADAVTNAVSEDVVFGYDGSSDSPAYSRPTAGGALTTYVSGPGLSAIDVGGTITYELANAHGDVIGTADAAGAFSAYPDVDEFGVGPTPATRRGWLGAKDRFSTGGDLGLIRMGVRLYEPRLGRFLSVDPVDGGSANDYDYVNQDPVNDLDLEGTWPKLKIKCRWCRKALKVTAIAGGIAGAMACGASVVCGVAVGAAAGAGAYAASRAGTKSFRWSELAVSAGIGGALGGLTARGYLGGGNELKIGNVRIGSGKWAGGKGRPWQTRVPHYHRGATNKLRKLHRPWQGGF